MPVDQLCRRLGSDHDAAPALPSMILMSRGDGGVCGALLDAVSRASCQRLHDETSLPPCQIALSSARLRTPSSTSAPEFGPVRSVTCETATCPSEGHLSVDLASTKPARWRGGFNQMILVLHLTARHRVHVSQLSTRTRLRVRSLRSSSSGRRGPCGRARSPCDDSQSRPSDTSNRAGLFAPASSVGTSSFTADSGLRDLGAVEATYRDQKVVPAPPHLTGSMAEMSMEARLSDFSPLVSGLVSPAGRHRRRHAFGRRDQSSEVELHRRRIAPTGVPAVVGTHSPKGQPVPVLKLAPRAVKAVSGGITLKPSTDCVRSFCPPEHHLLNSGKGASSPESRRAARDARSGQQKRQTQRVAGHGRLRGRQAPKSASWAKKTGSLRTAQAAR